MSGNRNFSTYRVAGIPISAIPKPSYGNVFFVCNATIAGQDVAVDSSGYGDHPSRPFATIAFALSKAVASRGDTIYVMPGHTENVAGASGLDINKAFVNVEALGHSTMRPILSFTAAASTIAMSAASCKLKNFVLNANFADVEVGIVTSAVGASAEGNDFVEAGTDLNFLSCIETDDVANSSDGLKIIGNRRISIDAEALAFVSILEAQTDVTIMDNFDNQSSAADIGHFLIQGAFDVLALNCRHNTLNLNGDNNAQSVGIFATGSSTDCTGIMAYNLVNSLDTTGELFDTATLDYGHFENYVTGTIAKSGTILPAIEKSL